MGPIAILTAAILATAASLCAVRKPDLERRVTIAALAMLSLAALHLVILLATQDTSYVIVVDHTRPGLDVARRIMGLWGGSAGSLLLFSLIVGWTLVAAPLERPLAGVRPVIVAILAWSTTLAVEPFERLDNPAIAGSGLSPILEHWAMLIHPPLLYLGLALALVPGAVTPDRRARWSTASIAVLTTALALGGGWAYVELGWGGWWAWDPVENAALIPWLLLVAGLHVTPTHAIAGWSSLLVWPAVFGGTAMTRTSLQTSVHAFANSESLGWALWPLTLVVSLGAALHGIRGQRTSPTGPRLAAPLLVPIIVLLSSAFVVALGTYRPFVPGDATDGSFYARFLFPVVVVGLIGLGVAPRIGRTSTTKLSSQAILGLLLGIESGALAGWSSWWQLVLAGALVAALVPTLANGIHPIGRTLAHVGMVLVQAGALGGTASTTQTFSLAIDAGELIDGHTIVNRGVELTADNPPVVTSTVEIDGNTVTPSLAVYPERRLRLPEVATLRRLHEDVQIILRSADDDGTVTITVNVEPLTQLVWFGSTLIVLSMIAQTRSVHSDRFSRRDRRSSLTVADDAGAGASASTIAGVEGSSESGASSE